MDSEETRYFFEKKIRDLALTEVLRWGFAAGKLNQEALDGIAGNMAGRYIDLTKSAGEVIGVDETASVSDNCIDIVTAVFSTLGVSDLAAVKSDAGAVSVIIDEESCYLSRDALGDFERAYPQVCLYPKFLAALLEEYLPETHKGKVSVPERDWVEKESGTCNILFEISE